MMRRTIRRAALALALALGLARGPAPALAAANRAPAATRSGTSPANPALAATRGLVAKLAGSGRGEAPVVVSQSDPMGGPDREDRARLALEPPDRVRLDFSRTGERIALRGDGGEWLQPAARQLVRIRREQAGLSSWLWEVFLKGGGDAFAERASGEGRYTLEPRDHDAGLPGRITVALDAGGLPAEVRFVESDGVEIRYRFSGWSFRAAKGSRAFTLSAPHGYAVVDLP
jgi:outer membrane lipoprotein-sorting protein